MSQAVAAVAVGANLGDARTSVARAMDELEHIGGTRVRARSDLYRSAPVGPAGQPDYINAAAVLETSLMPLELLSALQAIENRFGRDRSVEHWGPRVIDLDLVTYEDQRIDEERLTLPHPEAHHRCFVLVPLAQIAPETLIPGHGRVRDLVCKCDTGTVQRL